MPRYEVISRVVHDTGGAFSVGDVLDQPSPCVLASRIDLKVHSYMTDTPPAPTKSMNKPPYKVPSMAEINAMEWNGFNVISTFSGGGGSSSGYKMAGYRVLWASEFTPAAQDTYRANHPSTILDPRDLRKVQPEEILKAIGMKPGELDIFDGSPPCTSFSTAGKREKGWGKVTKQSHAQAQRHDDLFFEYVRILKGLQPKVFIAENVSGLVKGTAKGYFLNILQALKDCGYKVECRVLDAQWLGVPQSRQRTIFVGVRNDLGLSPAHPSPLPYRYTVRDALPWIVRVSSNVQYTQTWYPSDSRAAATITAQQSDKSNIVEPESNIEGYAIGEEWERMKQGGNSEKYLNLKRASLDQPSQSVTAAGGNSSAASVTHPTEKRKFSIAELRRICGFPDDYILTGNYSQQWARCGNAVPPVMMAHIAATVRDRILKKL